MRRRLRFFISRFNGFGEFVSSLWSGDRRRELPELETVTMEGLLQRERERVDGNVSARQAEQPSWHPETL